MFAVLSLLLILVLSLAVVRVATVALTLTGLSRELSRFQARSAFTGTGFTSSETEQVVRHPVRRKIIMMLMLLGNAGIITVMSSLVLSFLTADRTGGVTGHIGFRMGLLILGVVLLWSVASSRWVDRQISRVVAWALKRWTSVHLYDYAGLLHLSKGYMVSELLVQNQDWLADRTLAEVKLADEGILVLGVEKPDGTFFGAPRGLTRLEPGDSLYLYGPAQGIAALDQRRADYHGNWEHHKAVDQQLRVERKERDIQEQRESGESRVAPP